ncbi:hypothetical protein D9758_006400 [Tetrapyrgos nigripes]|uniref:Uncharacterized protein n=1 Tax=Tetrapyrgos nigripes TaxID=182062 RepID=A0A8H5G0G2_9AGAR|nr:hypothetical protein D9758_006400 [Tetrapyrgos nigripes]
MTSRDTLSLDNDHISASTNYHESLRRCPSQACRMELVGCSILGENKSLPLPFLEPERAVYVRVVLNLSCAMVTTCMSFSIRTRDWRIDGGLAESPKFVRLGSGTFDFLDGTASQVSEDVV